MHDTCGNCISSSKINNEVREAALKVQKVKVKLIKRVKKAEEISEIKNIEQVNVIKNSALIKEKPGAIKSEFIACSNLDHLKDMKAKEEEKSIAHKYYFTCPHYKTK